MGLHNVRFPFAAVPPIPSRLCSFCTLSIICKGKWLFSLTSLGPRWEGTLAIEQQWLTLFISHLLTRIGWSIKAVFWHRWQVILHWLSGGEWYAASTTLALYALSCGSTSGLDWFLTLIIGFLPYSKQGRQHFYSHFIHTLTLGIWFLLPDLISFSKVFQDLRLAIKCTDFKINLSRWLFLPASGWYLQVHCS